MFTNVYRKLKWGSQKCPCAVQFVYVVKMKPSINIYFEKGLRILCGRGYYIPNFGRFLSLIFSPLRCPLRPYTLAALTFHKSFPFLSFLLLSVHLSFFIIRPHPQGQVVFLPALTASKKDHQQEQTSVDPDRREELRSDQKTKATENCLGRGTERWSRAGEENWRKDGRSEMERGGGRGGWSWTVGESHCNAQWVRQKQEYRSTRPW